MHDDYLWAFGALVLLCVAVWYLRDRRKLENKTMLIAEEARTTAYQLARNRLSTEQRRNLARFVLAIANLGPHHYGTPKMTATVLHTHPLINAMQTAILSDMNKVFSAHGTMTDKLSGKVFFRRATDTEFAEMIEVLSVHKDFLTTAVNLCDKLREVLHFLDSPECDIETRIPAHQSLSVQDVKILESIHRKIFRPLPQLPRKGTK